MVWDNLWKLVDLFECFLHKPACLSGNTTPVTKEEIFFNSYQYRYNLMTGGWRVVIICHRWTVFFPFQVNVQKRTYFCLIIIKNYRNDVIRLECLFVKFVKKKKKKTCNTFSWFVWFVLFNVI